jgi:hypothetical protein
MVGFLPGLQSVFAMLTELATGCGEPRLAAAARACSVPLCIWPVPAQPSDGLRKTNPGSPGGPAPGRVGAGMGGHGCMELPGAPIPAEIGRRKPWQTLPIQQSGGTPASRRGRLWTDRPASFRERAAAVAMAVAADGSAAAVAGWIPMARTGSRRTDASEGAPAASTPPPISFAPLLGLAALPPSAPRGRLAPLFWPRNDHAEVNIAPTFTAIPPSPSLNDTYVACCAATGKPDEAYVRSQHGNDA